MLEPAKLGSTIKEKRLANKLTQEQLGSKVGVTGQAVSKWESGEAFPDISLLPGICRVLSIKADKILGLEDITYEDKSSKRKNKAHKLPVLSMQSLPMVFFFSIVLGFLFRNYHPAFFITPILAITAIAIADLITSR